MQAKEYRQHHGLSVNALAKRAGLFQSQVSHAEAGRPTLFTSLRLAIATNGAVMPWDLKLRPRHRRVIREFAALVRRLTIEELEREGRLRGAA